MFIILFPEVGKKFTKANESALKKQSHVLKTVTQLLPVLPAVNLLELKGL